MCGITVIFKRTVGSPYTEHDSNPRWWVYSCIQEGHFTSLVPAQHSQTCFFVCSPTLGCVSVVFIYEKTRARTRTEHHYSFIRLEGSYRAVCRFRKELLTVKRKHWAARIPSASEKLPAFYENRRFLKSSPLCSWCRFPAGTWHVDP